MDLTISQWFASIHTPLLDRIMVLITMLGEYGALWVLICLILLARKQTRQAGIACGLALIIFTVGSTFVLKNIFARPRPFTILTDIALLIPPPSGFSFPSGHAGSSFSVSTALFLYHKRLGAIALIIGGLIAISRVYLTVHYFTDILTGAILGVICAFIARAAARMLHPYNGLDETRS